MVMKKVLPILSSLLLLPLLLSNSPAPGPFGGSLSYSISPSSDGLYRLKNDSQDMALFQLTYKDEDFRTEHIEGYEDIYGNQVQTGYFLLPDEEALLSFEGELKEDSLSASGYYLTDLDFSSQEKITLDIQKADGKNTLTVKGNFQNPSTEKITYKVGVYAPTEKGNFYCLADEAIGQERKGHVEFTGEIPEDLAKEDFAPILIYDNPYYSAHYGKPDILDIIGYAILGVLLFIVLLALSIYLLKKRRLR